MYKVGRKKEERKEGRYIYVASVLYVQEVVTQPKILNRTILYNLVHVT